MAWRESSWCVHESSSVLHESFSSVHGSSSYLHESSSSVHDSSSCLHGSSSVVHGSSWFIHERSPIIHGFWVLHWDCENAGVFEKFVNLENDFGVYEMDFRGSGWRVKLLFG